MKYMPAALMAFAIIVMPMILGAFDFAGGDPEAERKLRIQIIAPLMLIATFGAIVVQKGLVGKFQSFIKEMKSDGKAPHSLPANAERPMYQPRKAKRSEVGERRKSFGNKRR